MPLLRKETIGYGVAAIVAMLGNTVLVFLKEENPALRDTMKQLLYHHWIAHGIFVMLAFIVLGFLLSRMVAPARGRWLTPALFVAAATGGLSLAALYFFVL